MNDGSLGDGIGCALGKPDEAVRRGDVDDAARALARKEVLSLNDLAKEPFVTFSKSIDSSLSAAVLGLCQSTGFQPRITQETKEVATIVMLVASGLGVALVPASAEGLRQDGVAFRPLDRETPTLTVALAWNRNTRSAVRDEFIAVAREVVGAPQPPRAGPS